MNQVQLFNFNGHSISVVGTQDEPLFIAKEVAEILKYSETNAMLKYLDSDEKGLPAKLAGSDPKAPPLSTITESGLYNAVLRRQDVIPEAKLFRKWVTSEVLPSIRKHGMYASAQTIEDLIANPDNTIKMLQAYKEAQESAKLYKQKALEEEGKRQEAEASLITVETQKAVVTQKLDSLSSAVRSLLQETNGTVLVRDASKFFSSRGWNTTETSLRAALQLKKWISAGKPPKATQYAIGRKYLAAGEVVTNHKQNWSGEVTTVKITAKGMAQISSMLSDMGFWCEEDLELSLDC